MTEDTTFETQDTGKAPSGAETPSATAGTAAKRGAKTKKNTAAAKSGASGKEEQAGKTASPKRAPAKRAAPKPKRASDEAAPAESSFPSQDLPARESDAPAKAPAGKTARGAAKSAAKAPATPKTPGRGKTAPARAAKQAADAPASSPEHPAAQAEAPVAQAAQGTETPRSASAAKSAGTGRKKPAAKTSAAAKSGKAASAEGKKTPPAGKTPKVEAGTAGASGASLPEPLPVPQDAVNTGVAAESGAPASVGDASAQQTSAPKPRGSRAKSPRARSARSKEQPKTTAAATVAEQPRGAALSEDLEPQLLSESEPAIQGAPATPGVPADADVTAEETEADAASDALTDFPASFGDRSTEDAFSGMDSGVDQEDGNAGEAESSTQEGGERKRRSRSRRGRGRKKAAAQQAGAAEDAADAVVESRQEDEEDLEEREEIRASAKSKGGDRGEEEEAVASSGGKSPRRKMFVSVLPEEQVEVVITEEGQVQEYYVEMLHQAKTKGNIYKGVVHNVDANLQAAFVSYGAVKNGFLQIDEVHPEYYVTAHDPGKGRKYPPIQKVLKAGQEVLVQVVKEPAGTKGAFLTTYLSLPGRFLVLTPGREQIGVSRKVENETERARLRDSLEGLNPGPGLGVIVRTVSIGASKTSLQRDLQFLKRTWKDVRTRGTTEKAPSLIYQEMDLTSRAVRDYLNDAIGEIWIDEESTAASVTEVVEALFPRKQNMVRVHKDASSSLFERFNIQRQLDQIHSREVVLPSGGRLVIDPTEALTAIDINSGRSSGKNNFEDMAYRTNMEAAKMIPLQLRLRDIGGQVVADFIEMRDKSHWREVEKTLRNGMKVDRARYDVGKIGPFGLLEMVRQRLGSSAISVSSEPCPCCNGTGVRRNMEWQSQHALREILRLMRNAQAQDESLVLYQADPSVALHLLNHKRQRLTEMEQAHGVRLEIQIKPQLAV